MFRHQGKNRTYIHNLRLASLLSLVAGMVNVTGILSVKTLTTNVTGHFAFFAEDLFNKQYSIAFNFLLYILSFLIGAFTSNFIVELGLRKRLENPYSYPVAIEIIILSSVGFFGTASLTILDGSLIACCLLFAMGLQNALVTNVSQSIVRTTHLTGIFTDLGIELSQLFFYKKTTQFRQLSKSIYLKLAIIGCFFMGCVGGGFLYYKLGIKTLFVAAIFLIIALFYDTIRFHLFNLKRRVKGSGA